MKVDVILEAGATSADVLRLGKLAEAAGIHAIWVAAFPGRRDPFVTLPALAQATARIRLGVMPVSPYEIHPVKLAEQLHTLNELAGGRAQLLVGGLGKSVMNATGLRPVRRVRAVQETVSILRGARSRQPFSFAGELYQAHNFCLPFACDVAAPRLYVAANGPQMLRMAARDADGVMMSDVTSAHMVECFQHLEEGAAQRRHPPLRVNNFWAWHVKPTTAAAVAEARRELVWRGALQRWHISPFLTPAQCDLVGERWSSFLDAFLRQTEDIDGVPDDVVTALIQGLTFTGDYSAIPEIAERIRALGALGQTEIALRLHKDREAAIDAIGGRLLSALG